MNGYGMFKYGLDFMYTTGEYPLDFYEVREWFWSTYGPSREFFSHKKLKNAGENKHWCWSNDHHQTGYTRIIYITGDEELSFFKLRWA